MTRYGEEYKLNTEEMENIATYMNDEIREDLHFEMAVLRLKWSQQQNMRHTWSMELGT